MAVADVVHAVLAAKADALVHLLCADDLSAFVEQRVSGLEVRFFPSFAVATLFVHDRFVADGRGVNATFQALSVFAEGGAGWQWAAGQTKAP